jgi:co-chaperonin GroES (HSP10)
MKNLSEKHVLPTKVLLLPKKDEEKKTNSGLIIPETVNKVSSLGTAVIVGSAVKEVSVGNSIMFSPHAGVRVKHNDIEYVLINNTDILLFW